MIAFGPNAGPSEPWQRILSEAENVVFAIEKTSFGTYFDDFKGGVRDNRFLEPIYQ